MTISDHDIIGRIAAGDKNGYALLLERYRGKVMTLALRMLPRREEAEEAAQDAFVRAFRSLHQFEQRAQFSTWLYRITYNVCVTQISRRRIATHSIDEEDSPELMDSADSVEETMESRELRDALNRAIAKLKPEYASLITLFYMHEQTHEEIGVITGLPLGTIKNRLHRGRIELRRILRRENIHSSLLHT